MDQVHVCSVSNFSDIFVELKKDHPIINVSHLNKMSYLSFSIWLSQLIYPFSILITWKKDLLFFFQWLHSVVVYKSKFIHLFMYLFDASKQLVWGDLTYQHLTLQIVLLFNLEGQGKKKRKRDKQQETFLCWFTLQKPQKLGSGKTKEGRNGNSTLVPSVGHRTEVLDLLPAFSKGAH